MPKIYDEYETEGVAIMPHLVFEGIVKNYKLALAPVTEKEREKIAK